MSGIIPGYAGDPFSDEGIADPYPHYQAMRELGPVVRLEAQDLLAVARYDVVEHVLRHPDVFVSSKGISFNDELNGRRHGSVITSDGADHAAIRKIEIEPFGPKALNELRSLISNTAERLIDDLLSCGDWLDGVRDIASHLPLTVVMDLGGLPPVARDRMLAWASAVFNLQGPLNQRAKAAIPTLQEMYDYVYNDIDSSTVSPNSWAARAFRLAGEGVIAHDRVPDILLDFIAPSLDTTIAGTGNLLMLLGQNPEQWEILRSDRSKIPNAINEALRLETPIRCFTRVAAEDTSIDGISIPKDSRVAIFYASANRDPRKWPDADRFDVTRRSASEQLAFGVGRHQCIGNNLARLEMAAILTAMLDRVRRIEIGEPIHSLSNLLRTLRQLPIKLYQY